MQSYGMSKEGLRRLQWRSARTSFVITLLLIGIALSPPLRNNERLSGRTGSWIIIYLFFVLSAGTWLSVRSTKRSWGSYRIDLSDEQLKRSQFRIPEIALDRAEVRQIEEMPGRGLVVYTGDAERFVFIPEGVEEYKNVRTQLGAWAPVRAVPTLTTWRRHWLGLTTALLVVAWMIATMVSDVIAFVVPSAFIISVFLLWSFIAAQRSLHLDRRTKLGMWLVIFPILGLTLKSTHLLASLAIPR